MPEEIPDLAISVLRRKDMAYRKAAIATAQAEGMPAKSRYRQPCNHCGICCLTGPCFLAHSLNPDLPVHGPCEHIVRQDGKILCGLALKEKAAGEPVVVETALALGKGCSMVDDDTPVREAEEFQRATVEELSSQSERVWKEQFNARPMRLVELGLVSGMTRMAILVNDLMQNGVPKKP